MHLIWFSIVLPGMLCVVWMLPESRQPWIWGLTFGIAVLGLIGLVGFDLYAFLSGGGKSEDGLRRAVFAILTATEIPFIAMAIGSAINWLISKKLPAKRVPKTEQAGLSGVPGVSN